jgi:MFS family permease
MFYGWRMVGVAFYAHLVASGLGFYGLPRLMVPLAEEFSDGQRAGVAMLMAAMSVPGIVIGPLVGRALTRFPLRTVMPLGAAVLVVGFLAASRATQLWHLVLVYATAVPIAVSALSAIGANALVGNWFDRRRAFALGVSQFGLSISGAVITFFISWTLLQGGWRATYLWFAGIALVTAPLLWLTITDRPSQRGLQPDGVEGDATEPAGSPLPSLTFAAAMRDRNLWLIGMAAGIVFSGITGLVQNAHAFTTDAGFANNQADSMLAVISIGAALGKLLFGFLGVRFGERPAFWAAIIGQALAMILLPFARGSLPGLLCAGAIFGLTLGGIMPALAALLARIYGPSGFGPVMGYLAPMLVPFQMIGAPLAAAVNDWTGSYDLAIYGFSASCIIAALALIPVRIPDEPT